MEGGREPCSKKLKVSVLSGREIKFGKGGAKRRRTKERGKKNKLGEKWGDYREESRENKEVFLCRVDGARLLGRADPKGHLVCVWGGPCGLAGYPGQHGARAEPGELGRFGRGHYAVGPLAAGGFGREIATPLTAFITFGKTTERGGCWKTMPAPAISSGRAGARRLGNRLSVGSDIPVPQGQRLMN